MTVWISFMVIGIEILAFYLLAEGFFERRYQKKWLYSAVLLISFLGSSLFRNFLDFENTLLKTVPVVLLSICLLVFFYKGSIWKKLFLALVYYVILYAVSYGVILGIMLVGKVTVEDILSTVGLWMLGVILSDAMVLLVCYILGKAMKNHRMQIRQPFYYWLQILVIPVGTVLNLSLVVYYAIQTNAVSGWLLADVILLVVSNILFLLLENRLERARELSAQNKELEQQLKYEESRQKIILDNYRRQRSLTHDFNSHLYVIEGLVKQKKYQEAEKYLNNLAQTTALDLEVIHTGNAVADTILNRYCQKAGKMGVLIDFDLGYGRHFPCPEEELAVILSNILQNALTAAKETTKKQIHVRMTQRTGKLMFSVRNTSKQPSGKQEKTDLVHGYGLENVKRLAEKNGGQFAASYQDGWFQTTIIFELNRLEQDRCNMEQQGRN